MSTASAQEASGLILAGGQGSRFKGQDKGLIRINGKPMIEHVITRFRQQVPDLAISANRHVSRYANYGFPILSDELPGYAGPLAGVLAGLNWCPSALLAIVPCDSPALSLNLVERLLDAQRSASADITLAHANERRQPVFALIRRNLAGSLKAFLDSGERKIGAWYELHQTTVVEFGSDTSFTNVNTEQDRSAIEKLLQ